MNWRPLVFCNGKYEVSSCGKVKSVFAVSNLGKIRPTGIILKTTINYRGYEKAKLSWVENGIRNKKTMSVHRLVAMCWLSNPENLPQVNHKDLNKINNDVSNLEWCTAKHNTNHAQDNGARPVFKPYIKKGHNPRYKPLFNTNTGEVFKSVAEVSNIIGMPLKKIRKMLTAQLYCTIPFRYLGEEPNIKLKTK